MGYFRIIEKRKVDGIEKEFETWRFGQNEGDFIFHNHFVNSGKQAVLDFMFNSVSWLTGAAWYGPRFAGAGNSTNTNAGVPGPTGNTSVSLSGDWHGCDDNDWHLSSETVISRPTITTLRAGKTCYLRMIFEDTNFTDGGSTDYDLLEFGIFLFNTIGKPASDPTQSALVANRNNAMLIRGVSIYNDGTGFRSRAITKKAGVPLYVDYAFADFEG